jgi:hypothetical protein
MADKPQPTHAELAALAARIEHLSPAARLTLAAAILEHGHDELAAAIARGAVGFVERILEARRPPT